uniref:Uncharacterized protein n=1 Tax=Amblyomma cajennense TaxID=34607 RepID=A0A023FDP7_AMBCJ
MQNCDATAASLVGVALQYLYRGLFIPLVSALCFGKCLQGYLLPNQDDASAGLCVQGLFSQVHIFSCIAELLTGSACLGVRSGRFCFSNPSAETFSFLWA